MIHAVLLMIVVGVCVTLSMVVLAQNAGESDWGEILESADVIIEHSFNGIDYSPRSKLNIQLKSKSDAKHSVIDQENNGIVSSENVDKFKELLANRNGLYHIRVRSQLGNNTSPYVMASIPVVRVLTKAIISKTDKTSVTNSEIFSPW